jgi:fructuronate reductase
VSLRSRELRDVLTAQDHLYSAVTRTGEATSVRIVGSIRETLVASEDPAAVLARLVDPAVHVVTMTVTEKGYCAVPATGALDVARPDVRHDIEHPSGPRRCPASWSRRSPAAGPPVCRRSRSCRATTCAPTARPRGGS